MSGKGRGRSGRGRVTRGVTGGWRPGPLREFGLLLALLLVLGANLALDSLAESSSLELLWFAGEVGYHLAAAEEALGFLLR